MASTTRAERIGLVRHKDTLTAAEIGRMYFGGRRMEAYCTLKAPGGPKEVAPMMFMAEDVKAFLEGQGIKQRSPAPLKSEHSFSLLVEAAPGESKLTIQQAEELLYNGDGAALSAHMRRRNMYDKCDSKNRYLISDLQRFHIKR